MNLKAIIRVSRLLPLCLLSIQSVCSQGQWDWVSGDGSINKPGVYIIKGPHANNQPGNRNAPVSWADGKGNLWLFGGDCSGPDNAGYFLNDVWKYSIANKEWSWISGDGSKNKLGAYATKGSSPKNRPGARNGSVSWTDAKGNMWLFGGQGYASNESGYLNDLWHYNIANDEWSWISGDSTVNMRGTYIRKGLDPKNQPGSRIRSAGWIDATGKLWLFGGDGYAASGKGQLNDLWQFDTLKREWSWMSGGSVANAPGVYVTERSDPRNQPGGRNGAVNWRDAAGTLWLFGGQGFASTDSGYLNDLWQYSLSTDQWRCMSMDSTVNNPGAYVAKGPDPKNKPAGRVAAVSWTDATGDPWMFGGIGSASNGQGYLNDLWQFNTANRQWNWISGDHTINNIGVYEAKAPHPNNKPGSKVGEPTSWIDATGNLWMFGGHGFASTGPGYLNDLWKFIPCSLPTGTINNTNRTLCLGDSINLVVTSPGSTSYQWYRNNDPIPGATRASYSAKDPGTYKVRLNNAGGCTALASDSAVVKVNPSINATAGNIVHSLCTSSTGSATIAVTGGSAPYSYSLDGGSFAAANRFDKLAPGRHMVTIRDSVACIANLNFDINQLTSTLTATASDIIPSTCTSTTGSATITGSGGTGSYVYSLDGGSFAAANKFDQLAPGNHKVTVRDNGGCTFDVSFTINQSTSTLNATAGNILQASCMSSTGSVTITAAGGTAPYAYSLDGGSFAAANKFDQLAPGNHKVTARDNGGCTFDVTFTINQSLSTLNATAVNIIHSACTSNTGSVTINTNGGRAPYTYSLDGGSFAALNRFDKLAPGNHKVTVKDSAGCTFNLTIPSINATNPGVNYSAIIVTAGAPYPLSARPNVGNTYSWSPAGGLDDPKSPAPTVITNRDVTYLITMTAASGCSTVDTQRVLVAKPLPGNVTDSVVAVPTAFTPNSNSVNDRLKPVPYAVKTLTYFKVFNRWGQLVFETNTVGVGWDGTLKGKPQPTETYTWILECISANGAKIKRSGRSLLIR